MVVCHLHVHVFVRICEEIAKQKGFVNDLSNYNVQQ